MNLASRICGAARGGQVLLTEVVLNSVLESLPPGWEVTESRTLLGGGEEDLSKVGGKIEGVQPLPVNLKGKIISIGPGLTTQNNPPAFTFRYLYLLTPKGAKELPILAAEQARHGRPSRFLSDERAQPVEQDARSRQGLVLHPHCPPAHHTTWLPRSAPRWICKRFS